MRGIIFDMDGTMVDNMMIHHRAWQAKLRELGLDLSIEEVMKKVHGINEEILERLFGDALTPEQRKQFSFEKEATYRNIFKPELKLVDGLHDLLLDMKEQGVPMGIGSAAPPENVNFVLDNLNIRHFFNSVLNAQHVEKGKPDPEVYLKVADQLKCVPKDCLIFEDSPTGAEAAMRANCKTIIITTTHSVSEFAQFPNIIKFIKDFRELKSGFLNQI